MAEVIQPTPDHGPILEATDARQGRRGLHILWVLLISTILAATVLFVAWGMRSGDLAAADRTETPATAESTATALPGASAPTAANPGPTSTAPN